MSRSLAISPVAAGFLVLLFLDPGFSEIKNMAPTIVLVFVVIWGVIKLAPTWKEVKMRELDIREKEVTQREQQSMAVQTLAECTRDIAIEMKHTAEALRIAERVTIMRGEALQHLTEDLEARVDALDGKAAAATSEAKA